ncbi:MAG: DMT family transporter [Burkholderiales bacterium]|nr:MAG: DMT family transporter [Burkholderiales bacterium]
MSPKSIPSLSGPAFTILLLIALMMGANHVAARFAFDSGVSVATAVLFRSGVTALVVLLILRIAGVGVSVPAAQRRPLLLVGVLISVQSLCLYAAVARLPVALALLAFNAYPLWTALWARLLYGERPEPQVLRAMPLILLGLAFALDVSGAASGLGTAGHWGRIGAGVLFATAAAATFGCALVLTQHGTAGLDGRLRTASTMGIVAMVALAVVMAQGGVSLPKTTVGWWGLAGLTVLYGTAFTVMFTVLPRLGVVGNSAIMNVEPIFALVLAWLLLHQSIAPMQVAGGLIVVGTVMWLGLRRR